MLATQTTVPVLPAAEARPLPWNVMGGGLDAKHATVGAALEAHGLDFTVDMRPILAADVDQDNPDGYNCGAELEAPKHRAIVRPMPDGSRAVVGVTGRRFTPIPNAEAFSVADLLVAEYGAKITGAADYHGGSASLLVVTMPEPIVVATPGGPDKTGLHLLIKNAHDGSSALTFSLTGVRVACTNAVQAAIRDAARTWKVTHTPNAALRVSLAHQSIIQAMTYRDAFQAEAQAMMDQAMVDAEFQKMLARLWPVADGKEDTRAGENRLAIRDDVENLYHTSDTLDGLRGTLWGGYNAITEWVDWGRPVRNGDIQRAQGSLEGAPVKMKEQVWDLFSAAAR